MGGGGESKFTNCWLGVEGGGGLEQVGVWWEVSRNLKTSIRKLYWYRFSRGIHTSMHKYNSFLFSL